MELSYVTYLFSHRTKRIDIKLHYMRDLLSNKKVILWLDSGWKMVRFRFFSSCEGLKILFTCVLPGVTYLRLIMQHQKLTSSNRNANYSEYFTLDKFLLDILKFSFSIRN